MSGKNTFFEFGAPHHESFIELLRQAQSYAEEYANQIDGMRAFPSNESLGKLENFDEPLPPTSTCPTAMLEQLNDSGARNTVAQTGGRYFGFVNGGAYPPTVAARWLADVWDQNTPMQVSSPIVSKLESVCEKWLVELLGLPENTACGFVSGTSVSMVCGIGAARNHLLHKKGWDASRDGLFGAPPIRVVIGEQAHATVRRALATLGLGQDRVEIVPADDQGRMIAEKMPELDATTLVIVQAGNVNTGAFDPVNEICDRAQRADAWVHVDGAFGLWARASRAFTPICSGMERADSWSADAHKTLNVPYDNGVILCRDRNALVSSLQTNASYLQWSEGRDGMRYTPEMSRRSRVIELWALLKVLGSAGVEQLVDHLHDQAQSFAQQLEKNGFRILNEVVFNQVLVACDEPQLTQATLAAIQASGVCWCGGAIWQGEPVIRVSVCSWATSKKDIGLSVQAFIDARNHSENT